MHRRMQAQRMIRGDSNDVPCPDTVPIWVGVFLDKNIDASTNDAIRIEASVQPKASHNHVRHQVAWAVSKSQPRVELPTLHIATLLTV